MTKRNGGNWTEGRWVQFVRSALRAAFRKWPPKFQVLKNAATEKRVNPASGRLAMHYLCVACKRDYPMKQVQVDHVKPIIGKRGFTTWDDFINALYCEKKNLQVMCKPCHKIKTKAETQLRKGNRK